MSTRPSQEAIESALVASKGTVALAARALGVHFNTLHNWLKGVGRDDLDLEHLAAVLAHEREQLVDQLELTAVDVALKDRDGPMLRFMLSTRGASRGYVLRQELSGPGGGPVEVHVTSELIDKVISDVYRMPAGEEGADGDPEP